MNPSEQALVERSRNGDRSAFEELIRSSARLVFARLYLDTGDATLAEDLTQETFLLAWRSVGKMKAVNGFRPWLMLIAKSVLIDSVRRDARQKRDRSRNQKGDFDSVPANQSDPLTDAVTNEEREKLLEAVRALPEEYRQPLMLRYLAGADYETISRQLALSNGSLRGLLQRGMSMLREKMNRGRHELD